MSQYHCLKCSSMKHGEFTFTLSWSDEEHSPAATRCPRCGALKSGPDVRKQT